MFFDLTDGRTDVNMHEMPNGSKKIPFNLLKVTHVMIFSTDDAKVNCETKTLS